MSEIASAKQLRGEFVRTALVLVPLVLLAGMVSGAASGSGAGNGWFVSLVKPAINPPPIVFPVVWTLLYASMGIAAAMVASARGAAGRGLALVVFAGQLLVNLAWSPVFFGMHRIALALVVIAALDAAVLATVVLFIRVRRVAGLILLPYLGWVLFATALNAQFLQLNPRADGHFGGAPMVRLQLRP